MPNPRIRQLDFLVMQMNLIGTYLDAYPIEFDEDIAVETKSKIKELRALLMAKYPEDENANS